MHGFKSAILAIFQFFQNGKIWCNYLLSREFERYLPILKETIFGHEKLKNVIDLITHIKNSMTKCHHTKILKGIQKYVPIQYLSILGLRYLLRQLEIHKHKQVDPQSYFLMQKSIDHYRTIEPLQAIIWFTECTTAQYPSSTKYVVSPWMNHKIFTARYADTMYFL